MTQITAEAVDSLASNIRRATLAALGLMVGVASVVCVLTAGQVLENVIVKEMGSFGRPTHLAIEVNYRYLASTGWVKRPEPFTDADFEAIASMPDLVSGVSPLRQLKLTSRYGRLSSVTRILCVSSDYFAMERLSLDRGRSFNAEDDRTLRRAVILGAGIAEKFFGVSGAAGSEDPIGKRIRVGTFGEVEVIGVLKREPPSLMQAVSSYDSTNNGTLFVPYSAATRFESGRGCYDAVAEAVSEEKVDAAQHAILARLNARHGLWDGQSKYEIETGKSALAEVKSMTALVTTFVSAVAGLSLIVAGIGVMNVMLIAMKERTREIGTRKALGARGSWIGRQFLTESLIVCLAGGFAGVLIATAVAFAVSRLTPYLARVPPLTVPLSFLLSTLVAVVFGWLPARRAARLDPSEALRYE
jgi:ABC-type antimicrobial peptide transport system permease subunit